MKMSWIIGGVLVSFALLSGAFMYQSKPPRSETNQLVPNDWEKIEIKYLTFYAPPNTKKESLPGIDSEVWSFSCDGILLDIDWGLYSNDLNQYRNQPDYSEETTVISNRKAKLCQFRLDSSSATSSNESLKFISCVYFPDTGIGMNKLVFWANCKGRGEQEIARTIFQSIQFK